MMFYWLLYALNNPKKYHCFQKNIRHNYFFSIDNNKKMYTVLLLFVLLMTAVLVSIWDKETSFSIDGHSYSLIIWQKMISNEIIK